MDELELLQERMKDSRGKKVIFLSHCLLNENTRYLGGACRAGCVDNVVEDCTRNGYGIVQMPCPEQIAWGGVLKRWMLVAIGARHKRYAPLLPLAYPIFLWHTRRIYQRLARSVVSQIRDYLTSDYVVVGVVGVDGSPSCGVNKTLDMKRSLASLANVKASAITANSMNFLVKQSVVLGNGLFIRLLLQQLQRKGLNVAFTAHDLIAELDSQSQLAA